MKLRKTGIGTDQLAEALAKIEGIKTPIAIEDFSRASEETLQTLLLSRMNLASNLRRDIDELVLRLAEQLAEAKIAQMLLQMKESRKDKQPRP